MLTALEQHLLVHHIYVPSAAHFLDGDHDSMQGGAGPGRAYWTTSSKGIDYTMPGDERPEVVYNAKGFTKDRREAHRLTWAAIRDHMAHQPASLRQELHDALAAHRAEWQRHWDATHAISPNGYWRADPETIEALGAEGDRHHAAERPIRDRIRTVVLALLPLHDQADDEPADLIEWAERLA